MTEHVEIEGDHPIEVVTSPGGFTCESDRHCYSILDRDGLREGEMRSDGFRQWVWLYNQWYIMNTSTHTIGLDLDIEREVDDALERKLDEYLPGIDRLYDEAATVSDGNLTEEDRDLLVSIMILLKMRRS